MFRKSYCYVLLCLALAIPGLAGCSDNTEKPLVPEYKTNLSELERDSVNFAKLFPKQYASYQRNNESGIETKTKYKASFPFQKHNEVDEPKKGYPQAAQPYLKNLWLGYPFSWEYNEARGHTFAIEDQLDIDRINRYGEAGGLPATCWNCKTSKVVDWHKEYGDKFWAMDFNTFRTKDRISAHENSISCDTCHNPTDMTLRITSIPLDNALKKQGIDWREASRNEMRAYVCAQCHVEYYFEEADHGPNKAPRFPWDQGKDPENMYEYYNTVGKKNADGVAGQFADWVHPVSKTPMLKAQHPEFETWYDGPHGAAGVTCADCHMPYVREDGKKKYSSHNWKSPLRTSADIVASCGQCHADKTADYLRERVHYTQDRAYAMLLEAQELSVKAHEAVRLASEYQGTRTDNFNDLLAQARESVRKGQFFWDMCSAENSIGFHNPPKFFRTIDSSKTESNKAVALAMEATNYGIADNLKGNIRDLVPPLREWSRAMQMDQENLDKHTWTRYLKPLKKAPLMWEGQERVKQPEAPVASN